MSFRLAVTYLLFTLTWFPTFIFTFQSVLTLTLHMTLTVKLDLDTVSVNDDATYLGQRLFLSKVVVRHTYPTE